mmetsp:Transcript_22211/g.87497  ORF Transcript_22211/g.87497 Transcript_22211/m.87497 type:complete len:629 (-) Transcript_22211:2394-4280(-)
MRLRVLVDLADGDDALRAARDEVLGRWRDEDVLQALVDVDRLEELSVDVVQVEQPVVLRVDDDVAKGGDGDQRDGQLLGVVERPHIVALAQVVDDARAIVRSTHAHVQPNVHSNARHVIAVSVEDVLGLLGDAGGATLEVEDLPDEDGGVLRAGDEGPAVGAECKTGDEVLVLAERLRRTGVVEPAALDGVVPVSAREDHLSVAAARKAAAGDGEVCGKRHAHLPPAGGERVRLERERLGWRGRAGRELVAGGQARLRDGDELVVVRGVRASDGAEVVVRHADVDQGVGVVVDRERIELGRELAHADPHAEVLVAVVQRVALWVCLAEELCRRLAKVVDLGYRRLPLVLVLDCVNVYRALVGEVVEHVRRLHRVPAPLLKAEDQVDPEVQPRRDVVRLQRRPVDPHKVFWRRRPLGQLHVVQRRPVLQCTQVEPVVVHHHVGEVEELGDEFLDVGRAVEAVAPALGDGAEHAVGVVELAALQLEEVCGEGLGADEIEENNARAAVVRAVVEGGNVGVHKALVSRHEHLQPSRVQRAHWLREVAVDRRVLQVQRLALVVRQDPREDRVLREVVVGPPAERVQRHEVGEVADLPLPPLCRQVQLLQHLCASRRPASSPQLAEGARAKVNE